MPPFKYQQYCYVKNTQAHHVIQLQLTQIQINRYKKTSNLIKIDFFVYFCKNYVPYIVKISSYKSSKNKFIKASSKNNENKCTNGRN